jgi:hypothetical protein
MTTQLTPEQKKSNLVRFTLIVVCALIGLALFVRLSPVLPVSSLPTIRTVIYRVSGSTTFADLTYENGSGGTEQQHDARVPWNKTLSLRPGQFVYLSAQNSMEFGGITCEILVEGRVYKQSTSSGGYTIASCSGSVP